MSWTKWWGGGRPNTIPVYLPRRIYKGTSCAWGHNFLLLMYISVCQLDVCHWVHRIARRIDFNIGMLYFTLIPHSTVY